MPFGRIFNAADLEAIDHEEIGTAVVLNASVQSVVNTLKTYLKVRHNLHKILKR